MDEKRPETTGKPDHSHESNDPEAIRIIESADEIPQGERRQKQGQDWWEKDPEAERGNPNHPNMEPDNLKSNDM